jgi:hypothetical protein
MKSRSNNKESKSRCKKLGYCLSRPNQLTMSKSAPKKFLRDFKFWKEIIIKYLT